jgi:hypothetical protein
MKIRTANNILVLLIIIFSIIAALYGIFPKRIVYENKTIE